MFLLEVVHSRPGPSLTLGPDASPSGDSVESLCELEKALSLGSVSAMSERASLSSSSSGWVKIQSRARSRLLFCKMPKATQTR